MVFRLKSPKRSNSRQHLSPPTIGRTTAKIREVAFGLVGERLHTMVFTMRDEVCHLISLRKSNKREIETYDENL